ncbi:MAG TPA: hypothetical protein G4N92_03170 [Anaerolineae bacterium]|nr:hypothetical protein [Anaerolineae bacterium]
MISRLKPNLGKEELTALFKAAKNAVQLFEEEFAQTFNVPEAIAFPYGRSALWAFFKTLGIKNAEVVQPAYTCSVVAHATVLSGNIPRFVDISLYDYNMDLDKFADAITAQTQAVIPTHLFGYPINIDQVDEIVRDAEKKLGHKIWVVQDCAHSFGAEWQGRSVVKAGDAALFGLGISKLITSIFGGMLTINDPALANKIRRWRDEHFNKTGWLKATLRRMYLIAIYLAFNETLYGLVYWLQEKTPLLNRLTKAYHLDEKIHFPPDYLDQMLAVEASVGLAQLKKYPQIINKRREYAHFYNDRLQKKTGWKLPPIVNGATYSHYVIRVPDRQRIMRAMASKGVQLGQLIEYSMPHKIAYSNYAHKEEFPNSLKCSRSLINIPISTSLSLSKREFIVKYINAYRKI